MYGPGTLDSNMRRRSVYFFIKRSQLIPTMMLFDWPEHLVSIGQRATTTIAPQALLFMNGPLVRELAASLSASLGEADVDDRIDRLFQRCFGRSPTAQEGELASRFVAEQTAAYEAEGVQDAPRQAWTDLCQTLLSSSEFIYIE